MKRSERAEELFRSGDCEAGIFGISAVCRPLVCGRICEFHRTAFLCGFVSTPKARKDGSVTTSPHASRG